MGGLGNKFYEKVAKEKNLERVHNKDILKDRVSDLQGGCRGRYSEQRKSLSKERMKI